MKKIFNYDFENKTIIGSNSAIKRANKGVGREYAELCRMIKDHPDFDIVPKDIDRKKNKKKYSGLTFERMEDYIMTQPDSENKLKLFKKIKDVAEAKGAKYPLTKKWFLKTYPEYKENESVVMSEATAQEQAEAEIEALIEEDELVA